MKIADWGSSLFLMIFGAAVAWQAEKLSFGSFRAPGPGFFPYCLGLILMGLSLVVLVQGVRKKAGLPETGLRRDKVSIALAAIFAYALVLDFLGYLLSSFILMSVLIRITVKKAWWFAPVLACLISLASYILFKVWLKVLLPAGFWGF